MQVEAPPSGPLGRPRPLDRWLEGKPWIGLRFASDLLMLTVGSVVAAVAAPSPKIAGLLALYPPLTLALLASRGRYRRWLRDPVLDSIAPGVGAMTIGAMAIFMLALLGGGDRSKTSLLIAYTWVASLILVTAAGALLTLAQYLARKRGLVSTRTLIVGCDETGVEIARRLERHPEYGLRVVGFLDPTPGRLVDGAPPVLGRLEDLPEIVDRWAIGHVIVGFPVASQRDLLTLTERCGALCLETTVVPRLTAAITRETQFEYLGTLPLLNLRTIDLSSWQFAAKHTIDRIVAALLLLVFSPLMLVIAVAVRLSSQGPILFSQRRMGRDGQVFPMLKFRTMLDARDEPFALEAGLAPGGVEGTDRRTRVGRLLRRTSLDELPQLINVLRGQMSLVGPRPERPEYVELFGERFERYQGRHRVRAGITGWAQVHGFRGQTPLDGRIELDNFYIEHWSLALDFKILLLTIPALLKGS